jgi:hypothetical protein
MSDEDTATITDKSGDKKYFVLVPRLVLALCDSPFEIALWITVKDIAGEAGLCTLAVTELAILSGMSTGQAHKCLHDLVFKKRLLEGELKKDPGYHKSVWHLTVPDLWRRNTDWSAKNRSLKERVKAKEDQHNERSPGEFERSPGEFERSPGELKKNLKQEELKENSEGISQNTWVSLLAELKERMRKHELGTYREYFEPTWLLAIEDHTYTVAVPDEDHRAWLADRGTDIIERALVGFTGEKTSVEFVVREETV